ncbi:MAG: DNA-directed RNA polymerase subunit beta', partial [Elusimicrobia bacterium]|nr:DNA-directed RNA polymerase subunit beta' [Elusimicrobiota bacterium]
PTLHRLGIQAFEPVLIEGKSIQLHPLTCAAFNADFDGDQMAVHVPLSQEAQLEAKLLMSSVNNILSPASGRPIAAPSQDMVLGICYLTKEKAGERGDGKIFSGTEEVISAWQSGKIGLHARIKVQGINKIREESGQKEPHNPELWRDYTTVGRVIFNEVLPRSLRFINESLSKKEISKLVETSHKELGNHVTVRLLDDLKKIGYRYATLAGMSISVSDMTIPQIKPELIQKARARVKEIEKQSKMGAITEAERYNKIIDIWTHVTDQVSDIMFDEMKQQETLPYKPGQPRFNSIYLMADSGARGSRQQVRQLAGIRGLMAKPQKKLTGGVGEIIESPILSNFREGMTVLEYFISTHGGRKGLADTALKTADAGYLTRRLIDVAHDVVVTQDDCGTINGVRMTSLSSGEEIIESLEERVVGRVALEDLSADAPEVKGKSKKTVLVQEGEMILPPAAKAIKDAGIETVRVRSVLTCETGGSGVCAKCYGMNLATSRMVESGEAVGIIAAQSIGEPGTQLTLRTFHIGGTASRVIKRSQVVAGVDGKVDFRSAKFIKTRTGQSACVSRTAMLAMLDPESKAMLEEYKLPYGARIKVQQGQAIKAGAVIAEWDPYAMPIMAEHDGKVRLLDVKEGVTLHEERNKITGIIERKIMEHRAERQNPRVVIEKGGREVASYPLPIDTILVVENGQEIAVGDVLAKIPQEVMRTKDITGGLPRVSELFESRRPRSPAVISEIEGVVALGTSPKGLVQVSVRNEETDLVHEYVIPQGKHLVVYEGDRVGVGEALTDGAVNPHDILRVKGAKEVQEYLVNSIQEVYRLQGVTVNDRHIEVIVRQMLENVRIVDSGATAYLKGEIINRFRFAEANKAAAEKGGKEAQAESVLLGITKASLSSDSFVSAASFQETTRVLTDAATVAQIDYLVGLKENVIIAHKIPAGTGLAEKKRLEG